jgi:predicted anti-sigma-YlaC factor YlaD
MHGISEEEWVDYLDFALDGVAREPLASHLGKCVECRRLCERMTLTVQSLREAGTEFRSGFPVDRERLYAGLAKVLARYLDDSAAARSV